MRTPIRSGTVWGAGGGLIGLLACLCASSAWALDHSGTCSGTFSPVDNPHRLVGTCSVPAGQTLNILAGVILQGQNNTLQVQAGGTLVAVGTSAAQRDVQLQNVFVSFSGPSGATPPSTGQLANCVVTGPSGNTVISISDASPTVSHCTVSGVATGLSISGSSLVTPAQPMVSANTLSVSSFGIQVSGTAQPTLTGNAITTNNVGLDYSGTAAGTATGNTINFVAQGSAGRRGIQVSGSATPLIDSNTLNDDGTEADIGIAVTVSPGVGVQVTNNTIHASGTDRVLSLDPDVFAAGPVISGNLFPNGVAGGIGLSGTLSGSSTLGPLQGQSTYTLLNTMSVAAGATLTIAPGIALVGQNNTLQVQAGGTLVAVGTSAAQRDVQLQNVFVSFSGPSGATPASAGQLANCTVTGPSGTAISISDASPTVSHCTVSGVATGLSISGSSLVTPAQPIVSANTLSVSSVGIQVSGTAQPTLTGNAITTNNVGLDYSGTAAGTATGNTINFVAQGSAGRRGIQVSGSATPLIDSNTLNDDGTEADIGIAVTVSPGVGVQVTNNTIHASGTDRVLSLDPDVFAAGPVINGNVFPDGVAGGIGLSGTLSGSSTVGPLQGQSTYTLLNTMSVAAGATLTIAPGIALVGQNNTLQVQAGGTLVAVGTSAAQRDVQLQNVFVSFSGPSGATPASAGQLANCTVTGPSGTVISISDASPTVSHCTVSGVATGVSISGSSLVTPAQPIVSANTLSVSSVGIQVSGTAQPTLTGNAITTNNVGLDYSGTAAGTATGNTINFVAQGSAGRRGIQVSGSAAPLIDSNTLNDDGTEADIGIAVTVSPGVGVRVTNNTIHASGTDRVLSLDPDVFAAGPVISGNVFPEGVPGGIGLGGTLSGSSTLGPLQGQSTYTLLNTLSVGAGATLTIAPGITLVGQNNTLQVLAGGTLVAVGSSAAQRDVQLQNVFVSFSGPSGATPASGGQLANCTVTGPSGTVISISDASPTVSHCTVSGVATALSISGSSLVSPAQPMVRANTLSVSSVGIQVSGTAQPTLTGCTIQGASSGVLLSGTTNSALDTNTFTLNTNAIDVRGGTALSTTNQNTLDRNSFSLRFDGTAALFSAFPVNFDSNDFQGSADQNLIGLPSSLVISTNGTIQAARVPYLVAGLTVNAGSTLVVEPCTIFENTSSSSFVVNGDLVAGGDPVCPIIFSSQTPKNGTRWRGLRLNNQAVSSASFIDSCIVEFGGASSESALRLNNSSINVGNSSVESNAAVGLEITNAATPTITGTVIALNAGDGVLTSSGGHPVITQSSILLNGGFGMRNTDCAVIKTPISAERNYWGDDTGPLDNSNDAGGLFNPGGRGSQVTDCIDYDPWTRLGPSIAGTIAAISGGGQSGPPGSLLPQPLVVEVRSSLGSLLQDVDVIFSVAGGDGRVETAQPVKTGADGRASAQFRLGLTAGGNQVAVTARDINSPLAAFVAQGQGGGGGSLFALTTVPAATRPGQAGTGDVNGDGHVNAADAAIIEAVLSDELAADEGSAAYFSARGDVNGDGIVDRGDEMVILGFAIRIGGSR